MHFRIELPVTNKNGHKATMRKNNKNKYGVTLIELSAFLFLIAIGLFGAKYFGNKFGIIGNIFGFIGGFIIAFLIIGIIAFLGDFFIGGIPRLPYCENNKCKGPDNYEFETPKNGTFVNKCKCGNMYIRQGKKFLKIDENGNTTKYLVYIPFKGWIEDKSDS